MFADIRAMQSLNQAFCSAIDGSHCVSQSTSVAEEVEDIADVAPYIMVLPLSVLGSATRLRARF